MQCAKCARAARVLQRHVLPNLLTQRFLPNDEPCANARDARAFSSTNFFPEIRSLSGFHRAEHQPKAHKSAPSPSLCGHTQGTAVQVAWLSQQPLSALDLRTGGVVPAQMMIAGRSFSGGVGR